MKRFVSIFLLLILIISISASATLSSNASSTSEKLDYSRFEIEYLMNMLEHNGTTLNGSVDVYKQVMTEDLFHRGIHNYFIENSIERGLTAAAAQVFNSELNLIEHPEHFYTVVLLDILQSNELDVFNSDSIKSSLVSNTQKVYEKIITQMADDFSGNTIKVSDLTAEQIEDVASSINSTNGSAFGVYGSIADVCDYISIFADYSTSLYGVIEKINTLYAVAGANSKTIEVLNTIYSNTSNSDLKNAINYVVTAYQDLNTPAELKSEMSKTGESMLSYTVDSLLSVTAKVVVSKVSTVMKILLTGWEIGVSLTNAYIDAGDLTTGYLLVDAAAIIENALRSSMSSYRSTYNSNKTANNAEKCREAYRLTLATQYYATNMMQKLGFSLASYGSTIGTLKSFFGCDDYQTIVEICDSTRNIIRNRYYKWVGLAERMYEIVYDVNLDHAVSVPSTPVSSVSFRRSSITMFANESVSNIAIAYPTNAVGRDITYSSSNTSVAKVGNDGKITAVAYGQATITATSQNGTKGTCKVTVLPYKVTLVDGSYTIDKFTGGAIAADIPGSVRGTSVTKIADNVFRGTSVTRVTIPDSVTSIGSSYVFEGCTSLKSVTIGNGLTSIGDYAFKGCTGLEDVSIGDRVVMKIDKTMFQDCKNLVSINIGDGVTSIDDYAFHNFTKLTSVTIGDGITRIGPETFSLCTALTDVIIGDGVTGISSVAFYGCDSLKNLTLGKKITFIDTFAFNFCASLTNVYYAGDIAGWCGITFANKESNPMYFADNLYMNGEALQGDIIIPDSVTSIDDYTFLGCIGFTSVTIPDNVTSIGNYVFYDCTGLTNITIPDSVTSIGDYAFYNCNSLTSITIPDSVTGIGDYAFYNCDRLTSITIPDSVTSIGNYVFYDCTGLTNITIPDSVTSIGDYAFYNCDRLTSITIPDSVISIGGYAFYNCDGLTSITIPDSVTNIGNYVFYDCTGLTNITIPDSVTSIGDYSFYNCDSLTSITIPDSVTSIGDGAFSYCTGLTNITIPDSVTSIGNGAFYDCSNIKELTMPVSAKIYDSWKFYRNTFGGCTNIEKVTLTKGTGIMQNYSWHSSPENNDTNYEYTPWYIGGCSEIVIEEGVTNIGNYAFYGCTGLTSVTIPNSVISIGDYAFEDCTGLTSVTIPDSVTSIGYSAFDGCTGIKELSIPVSAEIYNSKYTFGGCTNIEKVTFTKGTGRMHHYSDYTDDAYTYYQYTPWYISGCSEIVIEEGVTNIGKYVFKDCTGLISIIIPSSVISIGNYAFENCTDVGFYIDKSSYAENYAGVNSIPYYYQYDGTEEKIVSVDVSSGFSFVINKETMTMTINCAGDMNSFVSGDAPWIEYRHYYKHIIISDGCTSICEDSFNSINEIKSVVIPGSVTSIGDDAFYYCTGLENVYYAGDVAGWCGIGFQSWDSNPLCYADALYINGKIVQGDIVIPDNITTIGNYVFYHYDNLTSVTIPDSVTSLGDYVFYYCQSLTSVTIPDSVTTIGDYAFAYCGLTSIAFPDSVTSIGNYAFRDCQSLISITIPDSVTSIGDGAFYDTGYYNNTSNWTGKVLYINNHLIEAKSSFTGSYTIKSGTKTIAEDAFHNCDSLTSIIIPDSVTSIGDYAFYNCDGLTSITIPDSVTSIGDYAFYYCESLTSVTMGEGLVSIGNYAFYNCDGLTSITIPDSVTSIGDYAFYYCESLTSVTMGEGLVSIGNYAFYNCESLTSITIPDSVTSIGDRTFDDTGYYNESSNWEGNVLYIGNHLIEAKSSITGSYTVKSGTKTIADEAFYSCDSLTSITIPDGVTSIGDYAFYDCTGLTSITIPDSVTSIGNKAFYYCTSIKDVYYSGSSEQWDKISIGSNNSSLTNATIHTIGYSLTGTCGTNLTWLLNPTTGKMTISGEGKMTDYSSTSPAPWDEYRSSIKKVVVESGVTTIGNDTFVGCENLEEVVLPEGLTKIGNTAFRDCTALKNITIPDSVTSLGHYAFYGCTGFEEFVVGNGVKIVGNHAFRMCTNLTQITLPISLVTVSKNAFNECPSLASVVYMGTKTQWNDITVGENNTALLSATLICKNIGHTCTSAEWEVSFAPTCTTEGTKVFRCADCGEILESAVVPALGHINEDNDSVCDRCGRSLLEISVGNEQNVKVNAGEIVYIKFVPDTSGVYTFYSSGSEDTYGYVYDSDKIQLDSDDDSGDGNNFSITYTFEACTVYYLGVRFYSSSDSGEIPVTIFLGEIACSHDNIYSEIYDSTCTERGYEECICRDCGEVLYSDELPLSDHVDENNDEICDYCGNPLYVYVQVGIVQNVKVNEGETVYIKFIPDISGVYTFYSSSSTDTYGYVYDADKNQLVSDDDDGDERNFLISYEFEARTVYYLGVRFYSSGNSGEIPVTIRLDEADCDHSTTHTEHQDSTCSVNGYDRVICDDCGEIIELTDIPLLEHTEGEWTVKKAPTCTTEGEKITQCTVCGEVLDSESIPSKGGHIEGEWTVTKVPTCTTEGTKVTKCTVCGEHLATVTIPTQAHTEGEWIVEVEPTCMSNGSKCTKCIVCGAAVQRIPMPSISHTVGDWEITVQPTTTTTGLKVKKCTYCNNIMAQEVIPVITAANGTCGAGLTWQVDLESETLIISGYGAMTDYKYASSAPWYQYRASIKNIIIEDGATTIGNSAFEGYTNLASITIPDSVTSIGEYTFYGCKAINVLTLGDGVETIGMYAFGGCTGLAEVSFGKSISVINKNAFYGCSKIKTVNYNGTQEQWEKVTIEANNAPITNATKNFKTPEHNCEFGEWVVTVVPTTTNSGTKTHTCSICGAAEIAELPSLSIETAEQVTISFNTGIISGFDSGLSSLDSYITMNSTIYTLSYESNNGKFGTGSKAILKDGDTAVAEYTILVYGDTNGDSWYDGTDAVIVSCLANGMLTKDDVSEAVYMAADCNHDGVIDQLDVDLLNQAGTLLANVDQSKPSEVLLETSSEYVEYISLIDQSPEIEIEDETDAADTPEADTENDNEQTDVPDNEDEEPTTTEFELVEMLMSLLKKVFSFIQSLFAIKI